MHRVQEFRLKYGWEQSELAHRAGLSAKVICNIENNSEHDCQRNTMIRISNAFGLPPSVIFFSEEEAAGRNMLSAIVSICIQHVEEHEVYKALIEVNQYRESVLAAQNEDQPNAEGSHVEPPSSQDQQQVHSMS